MVLANFKFGDLNALRHTCACVNYHWRVLNLAISRKFAKSPKFPAIRYTSSICILIIVLLVQVKNESFDKDKIAGYVHKAYGCPPLTYALKLLFNHQVLRQLGCWVSGILSLLVMLLTSPTCSSQG